MTDGEIKALTRELIAEVEGGTSAIMDAVDNAAVHLRAIGECQLSKREQLVSRIVCAYIVSHAAVGGESMYGRTAAQRHTLVQIASLLVDAIIVQGNDGSSLYGGSTPR